MAVGSLPGPTFQTVPPADPGRVQKARQAFFQAALGQVASTAAPSPTPAAPAAPEPAPRAAVAPSEPARNYRPGMLLDIKI